eukprot:1133972-Pelagomonas_calceolata.AAC.4
MYRHQESRWSKAHDSVWKRTLLDPGLPGLNALSIHSLQRAHLPSQSQKLAFRGSQHVRTCLAALGQDLT